MNSNLKTTKETLAILGCTDSTFYSHLEKQAVKPIKVGTRSFLTLEQIAVLKDSIDTEPAQTDSKGSGENIERLAGGPDKEEQHSNELREAREEIRMLSIQVGQWQRQAQTYQEHYQQLLDNQHQQQEKKDENAPAKNAGEKRWWDIFFRRVT